MPNFLDTISRSNYENFNVNSSGITPSDNPTKVIVRIGKNPSVGSAYYDGCDTYTITDLDNNDYFRIISTPNIQDSEIYKLMFESTSSLVNNECITKAKVYYGVRSVLSSDLIKILVSNSIVGLKIIFSNNDDKYISVGDLESSDDSVFNSISYFANRLITFELGDIGVDSEVTLHERDYNAHSESIGVKEYTNSQNPSNDLASVRYKKFLDKFSNNGSFNSSINFRLGSIMHSANYTKSWLGYYFVKPMVTVTSSIQNGRLKYRVQGTSDWTYDELTFRYDSVIEVDYELDAGYVFDSITGATNGLLDSTVSDSTVTVISHIYQVEITDSTTDSYISNIKLNNQSAPITVDYGSEVLLTFDIQSGYDIDTNESSSFIIESSGNYYVDTNTMHPRDLVLVSCWLVNNLTNDSYISSIKLNGLSPDPDNKWRFSPSVDSVQITFTLTEGYLLDLDECTGIIESSGDYYLDSVGSGIDLELVSKEKPILTTITMSDKVSEFVLKDEDDNTISLVDSTYECYKNKLYTATVTYDYDVREINSVTRPTNISGTKSTNSFTFTIGSNYSTYSATISFTDTKVLHTSEYGEKWTSKHKIFNATSDSMYGVWCQSRTTTSVKFRYYNDSLEQQTDISTTVSGKEYIPTEDTNFYSVDPSSKKFAYYIPSKNYTGYNYSVRVRGKSSDYGSTNDPDSGRYSPDAVPNNNGWFVASGNGSNVWSSFFISNSGSVSTRSPINSNNTNMMFGGVDENGKWMYYTHYSYSYREEEEALSIFKYDMTVTPSSNIIPKVNVYTNEYYSIESSDPKITLSSYEVFGGFVKITLTNNTVVYFKDGATSNSTEFNNYKIYDRGTKTYYKSLTSSGLVDSNSKTYKLAEGIDSSATLYGAFTTSKGTAFPNDKDKFYILD